MGYTYVQVIKILHFYILKAFSHKLKFLGSVAHEHTLKVPREIVQVKEPILVVQRVSLLICRCMVDWWFRSSRFISILIQKISLQISLVILSMTFIWHPNDKSNVYMVVLVDFF